MWFFLFCYFRLFITGKLTRVAGLGLVGREKENLPQDGYLKRLLSGDLDLSVRKEALDWIWKVGFSLMGVLDSCLFDTLIDGE